MYVSSKTPLVASNNKESEFGYVNPASVWDVLARLKVRDRDGPSESYLEP